MKTKRTKKTYSLRLDPLIWEGIVTMATENDLTISDQIGMILKWALKRWEMPQPATTNTVRRSEPGRYRSQYTPKKQRQEETTEEKQEENTYAFDTVQEAIEFFEKSENAKISFFPIPRNWIKELDENPSISGNDLIDRGILDPRDASQH